jgi:hypothetical protein
MPAGVEGLLRDKTRPSRIAPVGSDVADLVVALTLASPPDDVTHWIGQATAKAARIRTPAPGRAPNAAVVGAPSLHQRLLLEKRTCCPTSASTG